MVLKERGLIDNGEEDEAEEGEIPGRSNRSAQEDESTDPRNAKDPASLQTGRGSAGSDGSRQAYRRYREDQAIASIASAGIGAAAHAGYGARQEPLPGGMATWEEDDEEDDDFDRLYPPEYAAAVASVAAGHHLDEYSAAAYGLPYDAQDDYETAQHRYDYARAHAQAHALAEARARLEAH